MLIGSCLKGCSNQSKLNKNAGNSLEKVLLENAENSFLHISTKISENFDINHLRWSKIINPKKKKYTLRISQTVGRRCFVKKGKKPKKTAQLPAQMFCCEFCEICKNNCFVEYL